MFTGIITHTGILEGIKDSTFSFGASKSLLGKLKRGGSISINGACLTIVNRQDNSFSVDLTSETLKRTNFAVLKKGDRVNFELPLKLGDEFGGHMVSGHIDGLAKVVGVEKKGNSHIFVFKLDRSDLSRYIVEKGSVAINGVSLTAIHGGDQFSVSIIPYTWKHTNFSELASGNRVNIEVDMMAKYIEQYVGKIRKS